MRTLSTYRILYILLIASVLPPCAWSEGTEYGVNERTPITLAEYGEYPLYVTLYIAAEKGYFAEEGLDVTIVPAGGDEKVFAALLSGDAQFGLSDPTFVAIAGQRGQPGRVVYSVLKNIPAWGVARNGTVPQIKKPSDLAGFSVATYAAPSTSYTLQKRMFQQAALKPNIVQLAWGALLPALDSGQVDIALENEPNVSLAEERGARRVYNLQSYYPEFAFSGVVVLPAYLNAHPQIVQRMINAFHKAGKNLAKSPEEAVTVLEKRFPSLSRFVLDRAIRNCLDAGIFSTDGVTSKASWNAAIAMRTEVGDLSGPAPYEEYIVTRFAESVGAK